MSRPYMTNGAMQGKIRRSRHSLSERYWGVRFSHRCPSDWGERPGDHGSRQQFVHIARLRVCKATGRDQSPPTFQTAGLCSTAAGHW